MEGQTDPRWLLFELYLDLTQTNILTKFESSRYQKSIQVITAQRKCGRTDRQTVWQTDDVIAIFFNVEALTIMHK